MAVHKAKYRDKPLTETLKQAFGYSRLYGAPPSDTNTFDVKVAVTSTSGTAERTILIGNYTRQSEDEHWYQFERGDNMPLWSAARATSAAPGYFKQYHHEVKSSTGTVQNTDYWDGGLYFNNPISIAVNERRFLWPDMAESPPDIVLSLGTGMNSHKIAKHAKDGATNKQSAQKQAACHPGGAAAQMRTLLHNEKGTRRKGILKNTFETLVRRKYRFWAPANKYRPT